jgi:hypothetical protein
MGTKAERFVKDRPEPSRNYGRQEQTSFDIVANAGDLSREISGLLGDLSSTCSNKMALIKMQVLRSDDNANNFKRLRQFFNLGNMSEADRILA